MVDGRYQVDNLFMFSSEVERVSVEVGTEGLVVALVFVLKYLRVNITLGLMATCALENLEGSCLLLLLFRALSIVP